MTDTLTRRTALKASVWAVPVVAVAFATPLAAASEPPVQTKRTKIKFSNVAAFGAGPNEVGWNTQIEVDHNPEAATGVYLRVVLKQGGQQIAVKEFTFPFIAGYGNTGTIQQNFTGLSKGDGSAFTIEVTASASNADQISGAGNQSVTPHGGWK